MPEHSLPHRNGSLGVWRRPYAESADIYPGLVVHDGRVTGSITLGPTRLPAWAVFPRLAYGSWESVSGDYEPSEDWTAERAAKFLYDLLDARGEFARLLLEIADAERVDNGTGRPWWTRKTRRLRIRRQLERCLACITDEAVDDYERAMAEVLSEMTDGPSHKSYWVDVEGPDADGWYTSQVREEPSAISQGRTRNEAIINAAKALDDLLAAGEPDASSNPDHLLNARSILARLLDDLEDREQRGCPEAATWVREEIEQAKERLDALHDQTARRPRPKARVMTVPNPPSPRTLAIAAQIRCDFGQGGANFPGARELYAAATKIEAWAAEWEWPDEHA